MEFLAYDPRLKASWLGQWEVRIKILSMLVLVVVFATLTNLGVLVGGWVFLLAVVLLNGINLQVLLKRLLWVIPFAGVMIILFPFITPGEVLFSWQTSFFSITATNEGAIKAAFLALRVVNATLAISLLIITTPLSELLHGFRQLKVPAIMVSLIAFTLRYFQVVFDEVQRMKVAMRARGFKRGKHLLDLHTMKTLGLLLGTLFVRASERGDRIYFAMLSRGYRGELVSSGCRQIRWQDWLTGLGFIGIGLGLKLIDWGGVKLWL